MTPDPRPPQRGARDAALAAAYAAAAGARALVRWFRKPSPGHKRPLFPRWANGAFLGAVVAGALVVAAVVAGLVWTAYDEAPAGLVAPEQPVPFSHRMHVTGFGIDCRFCHTSAERAAPAGMPSTRTCVPCHNEVWLESRPFEPVRESLALDRAIPWLRVHDLPDFTYFHHGIHSEKGVGCESCHGRVDRMDRVRQVEPLSMGWCLDCHRQPEKFLRPRSEITTMGWVPARPQEEVGAELRAAYEVREMTHCTACHR